MLISMLISCIFLYKKNARCPAFITTVDYFNFLHYREIDEDHFQFSAVVLLQ